VTTDRIICVFLCLNMLNHMTIWFRKRSYQSMGFFHYFGPENGDNRLLLNVTVYQQIWHHVPEDLNLHPLFISFFAIYLHLKKHHNSYLCRIFCVKFSLYTSMPADNSHCLKNCTCNVSSSLNSERGVLKSWFHTPQLSR